MLLVALIALAGRLIWLQGLNATAYAAQAERQRTQTTVINAVRGDVLDRNGNVLATDLDARAVYVDPTLVTDRGGEATTLAPYVRASAAGVAASMALHGRFVWLAHGLTPAQGRAVSALRLPGVGVLPETKRSYPGGSLAADVVGFVNSDGLGMAGIEAAQDGILHGTAGSATMEVDPGGREIPGGLHRITPARPGRTVRLTVDRDIQWMAQQAIAAQVAKTHARSGTVIVLDPRTGDVLVDATAPTFDASNVAKAPPGATGNRTVSDYYEPGSINKVIVAAAALQTGALKPNDVLDVPPSLRVADATFHDAEAHGDEKLTFTGILAKSSNIGAIEIAQRLGNATVADYMQRFGFGRPTGVGLPGESAGVLPPVDSWRPTTAATIPFGQGMDVTAMQIAAAYGAVADDGVYVQPHVVSATEGTDGKFKPAPAPARHRIIDGTNAATLRTMLEQVTTENGTAPAAAIPGYRIAGKTGTANAVGANGRYNGAYVASFVGMAPADNPRLVVEVVLDQPVGDHFGGTVAAPVFSQVMGFALQSLRVPPTGTTAPALKLSD